MQEFNINQSNVKVKINGEVFAVKPIGVLDMLELSEIDTTKDVSKAYKKMISILNSILVPEGKKTTKDILDNIPVSQLEAFIKFIVEAKEE